MESSTGDVGRLAGSAALAAEEALVRRAHDGDHDAFTTLIEGRWTVAQRTAAAILGNEPDASDVVQEAFTSAWINLPRLRDVGRFDAWFSRILLNRCRDALRRRRRNHEVVLETAIVRGKPDIDTDLSALDSAFETLDVQQRNLLVQHHLHHRPLADISRELGIPLGTVKWRLHRARRALERALEAER